MIVFDLDNTVWTPELYQLRSLQRQGKLPKAGRDVKLFPGAKAILNSIRKDRQKWSGVKFAVASRTNQPEWAHHLLADFGIDDLFEYAEIFPRDKVAHFRNLRQASGIPYDRMLFFDDSRDGNWGNCVPVSQLGVLSVHCPVGLRTEDLFNTAIERFADWSKRGRKPGTIVEKNGVVTELAAAEEDTDERFSGTVKKFEQDRGFGFIKYGKNDANDVFFHVNDFVDNVDLLAAGDEVSFQVKTDPKKGKKRAVSIELKGAAVSDVQKSSDDVVELPVFSMSNPFAAMMTNGFKTLETRNNDMFLPFVEGTQMLVRIGHRPFPDGDKHIGIMRKSGLDDADIERLKSLPRGFKLGQAVAIVEVGDTYEADINERSDPEFERNVVAYGKDSGRMVTPIRRVEYLKRSVQVPSGGGVYTASVPRDALPEGWLEDAASDLVEDSAKESDEEIWDQLLQSRTGKGRRGQQKKNTGYEIILG